MSRGPVGRRLANTMHESGQRGP